MLVTYSNGNCLSVFENHRSPAGKQVSRKTNDTLPALILHKADLMFATPGAPPGADQSREALQWWEQGSGAGLHWPF
jgi:hypothetical protein